METTEQWCASARNGLEKSRHRWRPRSDRTSSTCSVELSLCLVDRHNRGRQLAFERVLRHLAQRAKPTVRARLEPPARASGAAKCRRHPRPPPRRSCLHDAWHLVEDDFFQRHQGLYTFSNRFDGLVEQC